MINQLIEFAEGLKRKGEESKHTYTLQKANLVTWAVKEILRLTAQNENKSDQTILTVTIEHEWKH